MDPLAQFDVLVPELRRLAKATTPAQLDDPTPCAEWKVRDLFAHLTAGATTFASAIAGEAPPPVPEPPDAEVASTTVAAADALDAAFRRPGALERTIATPFGDMPGETFARLLAFDLLMHMWDLATATGQTVDVPDDVVAAVDGFARAALAPELRRPGLFGAEVEPPAGASALERLVAFSDRSR